MTPTPDVEIIESVFRNLAQTSFKQYTNYAKNILCGKCIDMWFVGHKISCDEIGVFHPPGKHCTPRLHGPNDSKNNEDIIATTQNTNSINNNIDNNNNNNIIIAIAHKCRTHQQTKHDVFINYRVATEGKKVTYSSEPDGGLVELVYTKIARQKKGNGDPVYVFWDKKCLNYGRDFQKGFLHGLTSSNVIILLISMKVLRDIVENAPKKQDNVLFEYECALLQNRGGKGVPVVPVFVSEMKDDGKGQITFEAFDMSKAPPLPDVPHVRGEEAQLILDDLSKGLLPRDVAFLKSVSETFLAIRRLQGLKLLKRGEDQASLDTMVETIMQLL